MPILETTFCTWVGAWASASKPFFSPMYAWLRIGAMKQRT